MSTPAWVSDDPVLREAYLHGRTQMLLTIAVESLRRIEEITQSDKHRAGYRIEIRSEVTTTLRRLSDLNGGVIDDMGVL